MNKFGLFGLALLGATALTAPAHAGDFDLTLEGFAAATEADADFINADKLDNELSGVFGGIRLGAMYTFGDDGKGLEIGANYYTTLTGELSSEPIRNGNYLVHHTVLEGFSGFEGTLGWDFGPFAIGGGYGQLTRDVTTYQSCPEDSASTVAGFCYGSGVLATQNAREGLRGGEPTEDTADSWRIYGRWDVTERFGVTLGYQSADFEQSVTPLNVIGTQPADRTPHGATSLAQDFRILSIGGAIRF